MSELLSKEFVENRLYQLSRLPEVWHLEGGGRFFELDLKMCQLRSIDYGFHWGDESESLQNILTATPSRILKLDLSLNELQDLDHAALSPLKNLRDLNASLNKIKSFSGIEMLKELYSLNLSHNAISHVDHLVSSSSLVELNLSMNELKEVSYMPSMVNLQILNVSNNKLTTLDGIQSLPKLKELYAQKNFIRAISAQSYRVILCESFNIKRSSQLNNASHYLVFCFNLVSRFCLERLVQGAQVDLLPLTGCFHVQILNLAGNNIVNLQSTIGVLSQLKRLEVLMLMGNPLDRDKSYREDILQKTNVMTLDNISVRPIPRQQSPEMGFKTGDSRHIQNIVSLKEAARQVFQERMKESRELVAENVQFLQSRIVSLQNEQLEFEERLNSDLESCLRYLDSLSSREIDGINRRKIRDGIGSPHPKFWERTRRTDKKDYRHIKDTEELLKAAQIELSKDS